ncbi:branched-chain amino acid transport system substrate-binding protein [Natronocella acetinitrilica]|uniref:Branched-chain amino acid transport system substrate-binding protein n=1 Tax=Natronocella acetinitrilica TaxID=414046 RepID=A0AAE3KG13_9GAMM|nr:ABC transporter substrate-binding protein [Natronocella acetinitrilica]MCP1674692.1 branched-chain amino acid transport system substrate-binding protein [Natronocella acetinitrilica]
MNSLLKGLVGAASIAALGLGGAAKADDTIKFALLQDFTAVYTFVTDEYNQGQRDYVELINREGGIGGQQIELLIRDTGNEPQRGIEAYNRARREGAVLVDFLSTPVSRAAVNRVLDDEVVMITALHGRGDASDGTTFPFVFPMMATYWSQATVLLDYIDREAGGLEGKRIAHVYIDSPFGREPVPVMQALAERKGFEVRTFAYPSPGNEQSATWSDVRRFRPDHVILWGAGGGQAVSVREAIRNGIPVENVYSVVWMAETDARTIGADRAVGLKRFEAVGTGTDYPVMQRIMEHVVEPGHGAGPRENVGTTYYNIGVATMAVAVEGARIALEEFGAPLTGDKLRQGLEMVTEYDAEGMMPPVTLSSEDHQGGGYGRVSQWNGQAWEAVSDWFNAHQDVVWEEIKKDAAGFREGR